MNSRLVATTFILLATAALYSISAEIQQKDNPSTKQECKPSPEQTVANFFKYLNARKTSKAKEFLFMPINDPDVAREIDEILETGAEEQNQGKVHLFDSHVIEDLAIVVYGTEGRIYRDNIDIDPIFLRSKDQQWRIIFAMTPNQLKEHELTDDDLRKRADRLLEWYKKRKLSVRAEWREKHPDLPPIRPPSDPIFNPAKIVDTKYVQQRLDQGLKTNVRNNAFTNQDHLLTYAVRHGATKTVRILLSAGADVDVRSYGLKKTPLFQAAYDNRLEVAKILVKGGADVNATDMFGANALREAIAGENTKMVRFLLKAGCDPNHKNKDGESMATIAKKYGTPKIKKMFVDGKENAH